MFILQIGTDGNTKDYCFDRFEYSKMYNREYRVVIGGAQLLDDSGKKPESPDIGKFRQDFPVGKIKVSGSLVFQSRPYDSVSVSYEGEKVNLNRSVKSEREPLFNFEGMVASCEYKKSITSKKIDLTLTGALVTASSTFINSACAQVPDKQLFRSQILTENFDATCGTIKEKDYFNGENGEKKFGNLVTNTVVVNADLRSYAIDEMMKSGNYMYEDSLENNGSNGIHMNKAGQSENTKGGEYTIREPFKLICKTQHFDYSPVYDSSRTVNPTQFYKKDAKEPKGIVAEDPKHKPKYGILSPYSYVEDSEEAKSIVNGRKSYLIFKNESVKFTLGSDLEFKITPPKVKTIEEIRSSNPPPPKREDYVKPEWEKERLTYFSYGCGVCQRGPNGEYSCKTRGGYDEHRCMCRVTEQSHKDVSPTKITPNTMGRGCKDRTMVHECYSHVGCNGDCMFLGNTKNRGAVTRTGTSSAPGSRNISETLAADGYYLIYRRCWVKPAGKVGYDLDDYGWRLICGYQNTYPGARYTVMKAADAIIEKSNAPSMQKNLFRSDPNKVRGDMESHRYGCIHDFDKEGFPYGTRIKDYLKKNNIDVFVNATYENTDYYVKIEEKAFKNVGVRYMLGRHATVDEDTGELISMCNGNEGYADKTVWGLPTNSGDLDITKLTPTQMMKLYPKDPALLSEAEKSKLFGDKRNWQIPRFEYQKVSGVMIERLFLQPKLEEIDNKIKEGEKEYDDAKKEYENQKKKLTEGGKTDVEADFSHLFYLNPTDKLKFENIFPVEDGGTYILKSISTVISPGKENMADKIEVKDNQKPFSVKQPGNISITLDCVPLFDDTGKKNAGTKFFHDPLTPLS